MNKAILCSDLNKHIENVRFVLYMLAEQRLYLDQKQNARELKNRNF